MLKTWLKEIDLSTMLIIVGAIFIALCGVWPTCVWFYHGFNHPGHYPKLIATGLIWIIPGSTLGGALFGAGCFGKLFADDE